MRELHIRFWVIVWAHYPVLMSSSPWTHFDISHDDWNGYLAWLANEATLPPDLLARLEEAGLAESSGTAPRPDSAPTLMARAAELEAQAESARQAARQVTEVLRQGMGQWVTEVRSADELRGHFHRLQQTATAQIRAWDRLPHLAPSAQSAPQPAALARGVTYRVVYDRHVLDDQNLLAILEASVRAGEQAKVANQLPMRMIVRDDDEALIMTTAPNGQHAGVLVHRSPILAAMTTSFEQVWGLAIPIQLLGEAALAGAPKPLTEILSLLAAGLTDAALARELGISERTAARRIAELHKILGATSRFQLGVQAVRRGWIPIH